MYKIVICLFILCSGIVRGFAADLPVLYITTPDGSLTPLGYALSVIAILVLILAAVFLRENLADKVLINQAETPLALKQAREIASLLTVPVFAGSLRKRSFLCLS